MSYKGPKCGRILAERAIAALELEAERSYIFGDGGGKTWSSSEVNREFERLNDVCQRLEHFRKLAGDPNNTFFDLQDIEAAIAPEPQKGMASAKSLANYIQPLIRTTLEAYNAEKKNFLGTALHLQWNDSDFNAAVSNMAERRKKLSHLYAMRNKLSLEEKTERSANSRETELPTEEEYVPGHVPPESCTVAKRPHSSTRPDSGDCVNEADQLKSEEKDILAWLAELRQRQKDRLYVRHRKSDSTGEDLFAKCPETGEFYVCIGCGWKCRTWGEQLLCNKSHPVCVSCCSLYVDTRTDATNPKLSKSQLTCSQNRDCEVTVQSSTSKHRLKCEYHRLGPIFDHVGEFTHAEITEKKRNLTARLKVVQQSLRSSRPNKLRPSQRASKTTSLPVPVDTEKRKKNPFISSSNPFISSSDSSEADDAKRATSPPPVLKQRKEVSANSDPNAPRRQRKKRKQCVFTDSSDEEAKASISRNFSSESPKVGKLAENIDEKQQHPIAAAPAIASATKVTGEEKKVTDQDDTLSSSDSSEADDAERATSPPPVLKQRKEVSANSDPNAPRKQRKKRKQCVFTDSSDDEAKASILHKSESPKVGKLAKNIDEKQQQNPVAAAPAIASATKVTGEEKKLTDQDDARSSSTVSESGEMSSSASSSDEDGQNAESPLQDASVKKATRDAKKLPNISSSSSSSSDSSEADDAKRATSPPPVLKQRKEVSANSDPNAPRRQRKKRKQCVFTDSSDEEAKASISRNFSSESPKVGKLAENIDEKQQQYPVTETAEISSSASSSDVDGQNAESPLQDASEKNATDDAKKPTDQDDARSSSTVSESDEMSSSASSSDEDSRNAENPIQDVSVKNARRLARLSGSSDGSTEKLEHDIASMLHQPVSQSASTDVSMAIPALCLSESSSSSSIDGDTRDDAHLDRPDTKRDGRSKAAEVAASAAEQIDLDRNDSAASAAKQKSPEKSGKIPNADAPAIAMACDPLGANVTLDPRKNGPVPSQRELKLTEKCLELAYDLQTARTQVSRLLEEKAKLQKDLQQSNARADESLRQLESAHQKAEGLSVKLASAMTELATLKVMEQELREALQMSEAQRRSAQEEVDTTKEENSKLIDKVKSAKAEAQLGQKELEEALERAAKLSAKVDRLNRTVARQHSSALNAKKKLDEVTEDYEEERQVSFVRNAQLTWLTEDNAKVISQLQRDKEADKKRIAEMEDKFMKVWLRTDAIVGKSRSDSLAEHSASLSDVEPTSSTGSSAKESTQESKESELTRSGDQME